MKSIQFNSAIEASMWLNSNVTDLVTLRKAINVIRKEAEAAGYDEGRKKHESEKEHWYRLGWENSHLGGLVYEAPKK